jgi:hypothetical protein
MPKTANRVLGVHGFVLAILNVGKRLKIERPFLLPFRNTTPLTQQEADYQRRN